MCSWRFQPWARVTQHLGALFSRSMAEQMRMSGSGLCPAKWHRCPDDGINQALLKRTSGVLGASESLGPSPGPQEAHEAVFVVRRCNAWSQVPLSSFKAREVSPGRLLGPAPDWDYDTRRMVRRRILGRTHVPAWLNQPLKEQENVVHWVSSFAN